jgi:hypothetical protein
MKHSLRLVSAPEKVPTGIVGFDEITGAGLPRGWTTLLVGGPGSGRPCSRCRSWRMARATARSLSVILSHRVEFGLSQRSLRVQKFRGSSFNEEESPFIIDKSGFDVAAARTLRRTDASVSGGRVTSGVNRLDTVLCGGHYRGAGVLITGGSRAA